MIPAMLAQPFLGDTAAALDALAALPDLLKS